MTVPRRWGLPRLGFGLLAIATLVYLAQIKVTVLVEHVETTDYQVYRSAVQWLLDGRGLYEFVAAAEIGQALPFTYPPFAALVFIPMTWLSFETGFVIWTLFQLMVCVLLAVLIVRRSPAAARRGTVEGWLILALAVLAILLSDAVTHGISIGQISLLLVALIMVDNLAVPPRWRGVLVGLASAIKLLPLAFIPYYLLTRQWRAAINAGAGALAATVLGFIVLPSESVQYWTALLYDTSRVGDSWATRNKSLLGLLQHWDIGGEWQRPLWLLLVVLVGVAGLLRARRHHLDGDELAGVLVVGIVSSVISPITWPHHMVWLPLAGLYLVFRPGWQRWVGAGILVGYSSLLPTVSYMSTMPLWRLVVGDTSGLLMVPFAVLGLPRCGRVRTRPTQDHLPMAGVVPGAPE